MKTKNSRILRRTFLGGLGTSAAAAFVRPMVAQAQTGVAPQRLLVIHRPCGSAMNQQAQPGAPSWWWPTSGAAGGTDWVVAPGGLIDTFKAFRDQMVIMKGVHCPRIQEWYGDKHGAGMLAMISPSPKDPGNRSAWPILPGRPMSETTNNDAKFFTATDRSIDQQFLQTVSTLKGTKIPSIQLTPDLISSQKPDCCLRVVSYSKDSTDPAVQPTALYPEADPSTAFKNIFGGVMANVDPAQVARIQAQNKSVIDYISGDLNSLKPRLPVLAAQKVDAHLASIRALETTLNGQGSGRVCTVPTAPAAGGTDNDARFHNVAMADMKLIKTAFQCDLTRVASYTFGWGNSDIHFSKVLAATGMGISTTNTEGYHNISHNGGGDTHDAAQFAIDKYFCTVTAGLLADLKATPDDLNGGTMLDNTLVVFWNECSVGNPHDTQNMPTLLFGGKFLKMNGGRYFDYSTLSGGKGRYMSDFWVQTSKAWAQAVPGYTPFTSYGAPQWNTGSLDGIYL